ncbi:MAG: MFS transporter [Candidatus Thermoplasmatota archaeon]|jgi:MFS family permease|nr:MFS transporter [Candidatus Thermoplasmatota archaeon]
MVRKYSFRSKKEDKVLRSPTPLKGSKDADLRRLAFQVIIAFGIVSLLGDMLYEGARSVNGPYLQTLGANAIAVGVIAGIGEFLGYGIRLLSGYLSDKGRSYWLFTFVGYGLLAAVPMLALTGIWQVAGMFIVIERFGKALRSPAKDTILSRATKRVGTGFGFGLHEAMDQIGAFAGPMVFTVLFLVLGGGTRSSGDYRLGYALLIVPFLFLIMSLFYAHRKVPDPDILEAAEPGKKGQDGLSKIFWLYVVFVFVTTLGFVSFALMGFHFKETGLVPDAQIPLFYGLGMAVDAGVALIVGKAYDKLKERGNSRSGLLTLVTAPAISVLIPVLAFAGNYYAALLSMLIWGVVMGIHETVMRSAIADLTPLRKRGTGYGLLNTSYGLAFFIGGALMGLLYEWSIWVLMVFAVLVQLISFPVFLMMRREASRVDGV